MYPMEIQVPSYQPPPPLSRENESRTLQPSRHINNNTTTSASTNLQATADLVSKLHPNTTINMNNSSDVVIGPMTQYQGAVTIYQYMDATVENANRHRREPLDSARNQLDTKDSSCVIDPKKHWLQILAVFAIVLGLSTTVYYTILANKTTDQRPPIVFGKNYESDTLPNLGNGHYILDRQMWGAFNVSSVKNLSALHHPIPYVVIGHMGVQTESCFNIYSCSVKMRAIQDNGIGTKQMADLGGNFYLGGDGNVYVGRGWDYENAYGNNSLAIIFLGDYQRQNTTERQMNALDHLLTYGLVESYLTRDYKMFGLNQTKVSKYSPGIHIIKQIRKYPRWIPCGDNGNSNCGADFGIKWSLRN
ncbi:unnamed protein product [Diamesa tonsa]